MKHTHKELNAALAVIADELRHLHETRSDAYPNLPLAHIEFWANGETKLAIGSPHAWRYGWRKAYAMRSAEKERQRQKIAELKVFGSRPMRWMLGEPLPLAACRAVVEASEGTDESAMDDAVDLCRKALK